MDADAQALARAAAQGLRIPSGTLRLAALARLAMEWSDRLAHADQERSRLSGEPVTCREGCAACCRELIPVSPAEAFSLRETLDDLDPERHSYRLARFREAGEALQRAAAESPGLFHDPAAYFRHYVACPFLDREACSIHVSRPLACREHLVLSDASHCRSFPDFAIRVLGLSQRVGEALARVCGKLLDRAPERIPLAFAPAWADENAADGEREWPAEKVAGALASQLFSG